MREYPYAIFCRISVNNPGPDYGEGVRGSVPWRQWPICAAPGKLPQDVFRFGRDLRRMAQKSVNPAPLAFPARWGKNSAAVSTTPTFSATAAAIHWFRDTPSSLGQALRSLLDRERQLQRIGRSAHSLTFFNHPGHGPDVAQGVLTPPRIPKRGATWPAARVASPPLTAARHFLHLIECEGQPQLPKYQGQPCGSCCTYIRIHRIRCYILAARRLLVLRSGTANCRGSGEERRALFRQCAQRGPEDGIEVFASGGLDGAPHRLLCQRALIAKVGQRRNHVFLDGGMRYRRLRRAEAL